MILVKTAGSLGVRSLVETSRPKSYDGGLAIATRLRAAWEGTAVLVGLENGAVIALLKLQWQREKMTHGELQLAV
jgi:hypothetical protein